MLTGCSAGNAAIVVWPTAASGPEENKQRDVLISLSQCHCLRTLQILFQRAPCFGPNSSVAAGTTLQLNVLRVGGGSIPVVYSWGGGYVCVCVCVTYTDTYTQTHKYRRRPMTTHIFTYTHAHKHPDTQEGL